MNKTVLVVFSLLLLVACSEKQKEVNPKIKELVEANKTKPVKMMVIPEEFVPEHIKHSHIEVVEHY